MSAPPENIDFIKKPVLVWIGDFSLKNDSIVGYDSDTVYIARRGKNKPTAAIRINDLNLNSDPSKGNIVSNERPFVLGDLKLSFEYPVDDHILTQKQEAQSQR